MILVKKNIVIVILIILLVGVSGYLIYDKFIVGDNQLMDNIKIEKDNNTNNIEKNNDYMLFVDNLKLEFSKFDSNNYVSQIVNSDFISDGYKIYLDDERNLYINYFNDNLNNKYGKYLITNNVLYFSIVSTGQGGGNTLYFINEDGTVGSANVEYGIYDNDSKLEVIKDLGYKDIVAIIGGNFGDGYSSTYGVIFIDINGNVYSNNLK